MSDLLEVAVTSDGCGSFSTCSIWNTRTGTNLMSYKGGGASVENSICFIRNEFLVSANALKPLLHIWPVNSQDQIQSSRFVTPGKVTALAISPDGNFCVAGVAENIYVWQISSGKMLASLSKHYQTVTLIKFTDDGSHFLSAGLDGMVFVWGMSTVVAGGNQISSLYHFSDHSLPVTDLFVGKGGLRSFFCSVSTDRTCKIYDLSSGTLLLNLVFQAALTSVTFDHLETKVYAGTTEGTIHEFSLISPPRNKEYHLTKDDSSKNSFFGHTKSVSCLSVSLDGETLMSGSTDENVLIWHIPSKQLIRTLPHKGAITNAKFIVAPKSMFDQEIKLNLIVNHFQRMVDADDLENHVVEILVTENHGADVDFRMGENGSSFDNNQELEKLRNEVNNLKKINKEIFEFTVKNCLK